MRVVLATVSLLFFQVCPALAMGNTVVLKPASYTRLTALLFAEICAEAGLPPGLYLLPLMKHRGIDLHIDPV